MDIKSRRKRCEKGILRRKTERRKCYPQEIPEDKILLTFCPQTYHLLWIKIFSISAHLPILSKKPITGVGVKSNPFWNTLEKSEENWYTLTTKHHMSHSTLHRLKHGKDISMKTVNDLCRILNCQIEDICKYVASDNDQTL